MLSSQVLPFSTLSPYRDYAGSFYLLYDRATGKTPLFPASDTTDAGRSMMIQCRTSFQHIWQTTAVDWRYELPYKPVDKISRWIGYRTYGAIDCAAFAGRWDLIEQMVGIPEADRTIVHPTTDNRVMVLQLAAHWVSSDTARSFCTLFVRLLANHWDSDLDKSIDRYGLALSIKPAIKHYLGGHTHPTFARLTVTRNGPYGDGYVGVCNEVYGLNTPEQLATKLVKPPAVLVAPIV